MYLTMNFSLYLKNAGIQMLINLHQVTESYHFALEHSAGFQGLGLTWGLVFSEWLGKQMSGHLKQPV